MEKILEEISKLKVVPVVVLEDPEDAEELAKALVAGGLPCAEVTFRAEGAEKAIEKMTKAFPKMLIGAGTVLTTEQVDKAVGAGAKFIVAPGLNPEVVKHCQKIGVPIVPGVATPTEIEKALSLGLKVVKFFPAEANGGLKYIKAISAPYNMVKFMPTGGIGTSNLKDYLGYDKIIACGGSWMVKKELIEAKNFEEIERLTREAVELAK